MRVNVFYEDAPGKNKSFTIEIDRRVIEVIVKVDC